MKEYLPYIASVLCSVISGFASYAVARKQSKADIQKLEKQHELDLDKEREKFEMEKEKMTIDHQHQMELLQKESENNLGNTLVSGLMKMPEMRQKLSQEMKKGNNRSRR